MEYVIYRTGQNPYCVSSLDECERLVMWYGDVVKVVADKTGEILYDVNNRYEIAYDIAPEGKIYKEVKR